MRDLLLRLRRDFPAAVLPDPFRKMSEKISRRALDFRPILDDLFRPSPNRSSTNRLGSTITLDLTGWARHASTFLHRCTSN
jgi:hypothetical protein